MEVQAKSTSEQKISEMVRRIVEGFHPDKIILFGSYARGAAGPDSDADLLVVMPVKGSKREKAIEIDVELAGMRSTPRCHLADRVLAGAARHGTPSRSGSLIGNVDPDGSPPMATRRSHGRME